MGKRDVTRRQALRVCVWCCVVLSLASLSGFAQGKRQALVTIEHAPFTRVQLRGYPLLIEARIASPAGVREAKVYYRKPGERDFTALRMRQHGEETYRDVVPDWGMTGTSLEYYITAIDLLGSSASRGFVGFPLTVHITSGKESTRQERLEALENTLETIRRDRAATSGGAQPDEPGDDFNGGMRSYMESR